jgi:hypothetical protein
MTCSPLRSLPPSLGVRHAADIGLRVHDMVGPTARRQGCLVLSPAPGSLRVLTQGVDEPGLTLLFQLRAWLRPVHAQRCSEPPSTLSRVSERQPNASLAMPCRVGPGTPRGRGPSARRGLGSGTTRMAVAGQARGSLLAGGGVARGQARDATGPQPETDLHTRTATVLATHPVGTRTYTSCFDSPTHARQTRPRATTTTHRSPWHTSLVFINKGRQPASGRGRGRTARACRAPASSAPGPRRVPVAGPTRRCRARAAGQGPKARVRKTRAGPEARHRPGRGSGGRAGAWAQTLGAKPTRPPAESKTV